MLDLFGRYLLAAGGIAKPETARPIDFNAGGFGALRDCPLSKACVLMSQLMLEAAAEQQVSLQPPSNEIVAVAAGRKVDVIHQPRGEGGRLIVRRPLLPGQVAPATNALSFRFRFQHHYTHGFMPAGTTATDAMPGMPPGTHPL